MTAGGACALACQFHDVITGTDFLVVLNHLARHDVGLRQQQAKGLRLWAAAQTLPVIAMGDFNFDYNFATQAGNAAFTEFLSDGTWKWVRPEPLIDTNWADHDGNGSDDYPNSMLDFVFVAGAARGWEATCSVVVRAGDFPDDQTTSDHRPVRCVMDVPSAGGVESIDLAIRKGAGRSGRCLERCRPGPVHAALLEVGPAHVQLRR